MWNGGQFTSHLSVRLEHIPSQAYTRSKRRRHSWAVAGRRCSFSPSCPEAAWRAPQNGAGPCASGRPPQDSLQTQNNLSVNYGYEYLWPKAKPVLRIYEIFAWIRIRGSIPLTNRSGSGPGCGSCYIRQWPSTRQVFCLLLFKGTFTSFLRDKKS